jgi:hypothetical protein
MTLPVALPDWLMTSTLISDLHLIDLKAVGKQLFGDRSTNAVTPAPGHP